MRSRLIIAFLAGLVAQPVLGGSSYRLDDSRKNVVAIAGLYNDCIPANFSGLVVKRSFNEAGTVVTSVTVEDKQGRRDYINVDVDLTGESMVTASWVVQGLQTLLREGTRIAGRVRLCGAAGRVQMLESVRRAR